MSRVLFKISRIERHLQQIAQERDELRRENENLQRELALAWVRITELEEQLEAITEQEDESPYV